MALSRCIDHCRGIDRVYQGVAQTGVRQRGPTRRGTGHRSPVIKCTLSAGADSQPQSDTTATLEPPVLEMPGHAWNVEEKIVQKIFFLAGGAVLMAAITRTSFSVLAIPIQQQFGLDMAEMGFIQSSLLFGYICGQVRG